MGARIDILNGVYTGSEPKSISGSAEISRKSVNPNVPTRSAAPPKVVQSELQNILNNYRSYTYNFTLSGLKKSAAKNVSSYEDNIKKFTILRSGGKGTTGFSQDVEGITRKVQVQELSEDGDLVTVQKSVVDTSSKDVIDGFNKSSPGKFDFFIDNLEIDNTFTFNQQTNASLATKLTFEVIEPYSINGFLEALHVAAVATGYTSYAQARYILKMEFKGYPDNVSPELSKPETIQGSVRYFLIGFTKVEVELTERGTRYKCQAVPYNEKGFGQSNTLAKPISMSGSTVKEVLENFIKGLNEQIELSDKQKKKSESSLAHDEYRIKFPSWDESTGTYDFLKPNKIAESKINELLKSNNVYKFVDIGDETKLKDQTTVKYSPTTDDSKPIIQFAANQRVHECIASVIRDSNYLKEILANIGKENNPDKFGMVDYFLIRVEVEDSDKFDEESRKPYQIITYIVTTYKIHYTRIPNFNSQVIDKSKIEKLSLREYNYIFTGENVDVLDFKLNFNNLFFEAIPYAMGNSKSIDYKNSLEPGEKAIVKQTGVDEDSLKKRQIPTSVAKTSVQAGEILAQNNPNSGQIQTDPYAVMAKNMHDAVINSKASMLLGDLKILGDPVYLVSGGMGNDSPKQDKTSNESLGKKTDNGEAFHLYGEVLITINFNNPIDIVPTDQGGLIDFKKTKKVPFSGVYKVNSVLSSFRDGQFVQTLKIMRIPGQLIELENEKPSKPADAVKTEPNPISAVVPDSAPIQEGIRAEGLDLMGAIAREIPNPDTNFTNAAGGTGEPPAGNNQTVGGTDQGSDDINRAAWMSMSSVTAESQSEELVTERSEFSLTSQIIRRLNAPINSGGLSITRQSLNDFSLPVDLPSGGATVGIPTGSNIGGFPIVQSSVRLNSLGIDSQLTQRLSSTAALLGQAGNTLEKALSVTDAGKSLVTDVLGANKSQALNAINGLKDKGASLVNGIENKINALKSTTPKDVEAIASKFGINISQLSGLGKELESKITSQLGTLAKEIPQDADLNRLPGLSLRSIPTDKFKNIPVTTPERTAPNPPIDKNFVDDLLKSGGPAALAKAFGVKDFSKIPGGLGKSPDLLSAINSAESQLKSKISGLSSLVDKNAAVALGDKFLSAQSQISAAAGKLYGSVESNLKSFSNLANPTSVIAKFGSKLESPLTKLITSAASKTSSQTPDFKG